MPAVPAGLFFVLNLQSVVLLCYIFFAATNTGYRPDSEGRNGTVDITKRQKPVSLSDERAPAKCQPVLQPFHGTCDVSGLSGPLSIIPVAGSRNVQVRHAQQRFTIVAVRCDTSEETRMQRVVHLPASTSELSPLTGCGIKASELLVVVNAQADARKFGIAIRGRHPPGQSR